MGRKRLKVSFLTCFIVKMMEIKGLFHISCAERGEHTRGRRRRTNEENFFAQNLTFSHHALKLNCITLYHLYYQDLLKIKKSLGNGCFPARFNFNFPSSFSCSRWAHVDTIISSEAFVSVLSSEDFFSHLRIRCSASSFFFASLSVETFRGN